MLSSAVNALNVTVLVLDRRIPWTGQTRRITFFRPILRVMVDKTPSNMIAILGHWGWRFWMSARWTTWRRRESPFCKLP